MASLEEQDRDMVLVHWKSLLLCWCISGVPLQTPHAFMNIIWLLSVVNISFDVCFRFSLRILHCATDSREELHILLKSVWWFHFKQWYLPLMEGGAVIKFGFRIDRMYDGELKLPSHYIVSFRDVDRNYGEYKTMQVKKLFVSSYKRKYSCASSDNFSGRQSKNEHGQYIGAGIIMLFAFRTDSSSIWHHWRYKTSISFAVITLDLLRWKIE